MVCNFSAVKWEGGDILKKWRDVMSVCMMMRNFANKQMYFMLLTAY